MNSIESFVCNPIYAPLKCIREESSMERTKSVLAFVLKVLEVILVIIHMYLGR